MKTTALIAATLAATAALSGAASAQGFKTADFARAGLERLVPGADVASLSNAEAVAAWNDASTVSGHDNAKARAAALINAYAN